MNKIYIVFDDEAALENGLPEGVTHEHQAEGLYSVGDNKLIPAGARLASDEEKKSAVDAEKDADNKARKLKGEVYADAGVIIPFTARAADAFMQVNAGLNLAVQQGVDPSTLMSVLSFDNGSKLPVAVEAATINGVECHKFADVAIWFYNMRNSFYQNT